MSLDAETSSFLALRLSCNRCRVQKLKCSVPTGCNTCERCTRAKVPCIFGRRTRARRLPSNSKRRTDLTPPTRPPSPAVQVAPATPITLSTPPSVLASVSISTSPPGGNVAPVPTTDMQLGGSIDSVPAPLPELEPGAFDTHTWDSWDLGLHNTRNSIAEGDNEADHYSWLHSAMNLDNISIFDASQSDPPQLSQLATLTATNWPIDGLATVTNRDSTKIRNLIPTQQRLIALISEMQQQLRELEKSPWQTDSARSLDDYPVGTILQLSQQFAALAGPVLSTTWPCREVEEDRVQTMDISEDGDDENENDQKMSGATSDTPTMLLVLCGYMWLVRIYRVLLGHFQKHLDRMPSTHHHDSRSPTMINAGSYGISSSSNSTPAAGPTLLLGELPCANTALGLQRIHTAVGMLLDALRAVEGYLGRGGVMARDLTISLLLSSSQQQDGSYGGLGKRVTVVKELLREKMGL